MDLLQIKGFHRIDGVSRMPNINEHLKYVRWNNAINTFEYNEVVDLHLEDITQVGNTVTLTRSDGTTWDIQLPNNPADFGLELPGNTRILFDKNNTIGGAANITYDYNNHRLNLIDSQGIFARNTQYDGSSRSILQYLGQNSLYLNHGNTKLPSAMVNTIALGYRALANLIDGTDNIAIGPNAGRDITSNVSGNILIGGFAGRLENGDNKLYIDNRDYATLELFKANSFLYGDFDLKRLWVNNRLSVKQEVRIGAISLDNTPEGGMVQFIPSANPALLKPQYYNNQAWVDFANSANFYLEDITVNGEEYTFVVSGAPNIVATIPKYPSSGNNGAIQLSNGNDKFTHSSKLNWLPENVLQVEGGVRISPVAVSDVPLYTLSEGLILSFGGHMYAWLGGTFVQLDNEVGTGEANRGENLSAFVKVYDSFNNFNKKLSFNTLRTLDSRVSIVENDVTHSIDFVLNHTLGILNSGADGASIGKSISNATGIDPTVILKRLKSDNGSVAITEYDDYIDLQATGVGGGEVNTGTNVGGHASIYKDKSGVALRFKTLKQGSNVTLIENDDFIEIAVSSSVIDIENLASDFAVYKEYVDNAGVRTFKFKTLAESTSVKLTSRDTDIQISLHPDLLIPAISGNLNPVPTNLNKTLTWNLTHTPDVRNPAPVALGIARLNLGTNLTYNPVTNTINSAAGSGNPVKEIYNSSIVRNPDGTVKRVDSNRNVRIILENNTEIIWDGSDSATTGLGWLAFENDYPIASADKPGIVQVDESGILSIINGVLSATGTLPNGPEYAIQYKKDNVFKGIDTFKYVDIENRLYLSATEANPEVGLVLHNNINGPAIIANKAGDVLTIRNLIGNNNLEVFVDQIGIGLAAADANTFLDIADRNNVTPKEYITKYKDKSNNVLLALKQNGALYAPKIANAETGLSLYYNEVTGQITYGNKVQRVPINLSVNNGLVSEDINSLNLVSGNVDVSYIGNNTVKFDYEQENPPFIHMPDSFIAFNSGLYSFDISEGTAKRLLNAPTSNWKPETSFAEGNYIFTCVGTTLYRYDILEDVTTSVVAGNNDIKLLISASDGLYAICRGRAYHVDKDTMVATDYGSTITQYDEPMPGGTAVKDGNTGKEYIIIFSETNDRWYYKEVISTYSGNNTANWITGPTTASGLHGAAVSFVHTAWLTEVDNVSRVYQNWGTVVSGTNLNAFNYYTYQVPSGRIYSNSNPDFITTIKLTPPMPASNVVTAYSITKASDSRDKGIYVAKTPSSPYSSNYGYEQAVNADVNCLHANYVKLDSGLWDYGVNVIVGGVFKGSDDRGMVYFRSVNDDKKQFTPIPVTEVTGDLLNGIPVTNPITFVYYDDVHTSNYNAKEPFILGTELDLYIDGLLVEEYLPRINFIPGTEIDLDYVGNSSIIINAITLQPNWTQINNTKKDYIKNKPVIVHNFTELFDVIPENYIGKAKHVPIITDDELHVDLIETEELETVLARFTHLADVPNTFYGSGNKAVFVNDSESGIEFRDGASGSFTSQDGKTITVTNGIITSIV
jgi:hypothetical protein